MELPLIQMIASPFRRHAGCARMSREVPMKHIDQEIAIETETPFGENVPIGVSSPLLGRLLEMARPCVRMAIEGASSSLGAPPAWLERASDIRTIGFARRGTQTVLLVKAPALGDAMPEIFDQQKLWSGVANAEDTVIQLIARAGDSRTLPATYTTNPCLGISPIGILFFDMM